MKYTVDGQNNFCRVFELPDQYSSEFCFGGGIPHVFTMVDWFNPVPIQTKEITYEELYNFLVPFLKIKIWYNINKKYLILCDFGASIVF